MIRSFWLRFPIPKPHWRFLYPGGRTKNKGACILWSFIDLRGFWMPAATGANDDGDVGASNSEGDVLMRSLWPFSPHKQQPILLKHSLWLFFPLSSCTQIGPPVKSIFLNWSAPPMPLCYKSGSRSPCTAYLQARTLYQSQRNWTCHSVLKISAT